LQRALRTLLSDRTAIIIAHRLSTVEIADRVLVVDGGRIVEDGPHPVAGGSGGHYGALHRHGWSRCPEWCAAEVRGGSSAGPGPAEARGEAGPSGSGRRALGHRGGGRSGAHAPQTWSGRRPGPAGAGWPQRGEWLYACRPGCGTLAGRKGPAPVPAPTGPTTNFCRLHQEGRGDPGGGTLSHVQPDLIPRAVLFGNPTRLSPAVSPDGTRLAYLAPHDGVLNVWPASLGGENFRPVTNDRERGVRSFAWAHDNRPPAARAGPRRGDENWHLFATRRGRRRHAPT